MGDVGLVVVEEGAPIACRLPSLDRRADRLLDRLRFWRDRHIELTKCLGDRGADDRTAFALDDADGDAIATALRPALGNQPLLLHQQGEAALQHPWRQLVRQSLADGADPHTFRMERHDVENGVKLLFGYALGHVADYMSLKTLMRHIKYLFVA